MSLFDFDELLPGVSNVAKNVASKVVNVLDPSGARLQIAGLLKGGGAVANKRATPTTFAMGSSTGGAVAIKDDWRIRVSVGKSSNLFYEGTEAGILRPLKDTMGVIFPYTPQIQLSYAASYSPLKTTHSNYPAFFYEGSEVSAIQLSGTFTVQNIEEGQYLLAAIYFFRASTKMFYGSGDNAGNPPPILFLNGYGSHYLPNVPCVLTSFQHTMPEDVDYVEIPITGGKTRMPTSSSISIGLQPVYSRTTQSQFNLQEFAQGKLIDKGLI